MQGLNASKILAAGLVTGVTGGILFGIGEANDTTPWILILGYILLGVGGIMFAAGFSMMIYALKDLPGMHEQDAAATYSAMVRCMVAMSIVDGDLDESEVDTVCRVFEILTGVELDGPFVTDIAEAMLSEGCEIEDELWRVKEILTHDLKEKILKAAFYILAADGVIEKSEEQLMGRIRKGMGFPLWRFVLLKKKFMSEHEGKLERREPAMSPAPGTEAQ